MKLINYSRQSINKSDEKNVLKVLRSDFLTTGPVGVYFEKKISKFLNCKYSISVNSASSGLHLSCKALDINSKHIVWTTTNTFVATTNCAVHCGAKVDLIDIELDTFNLDINKLEKKLIKAKKTKKLPSLLIIVHFAGNPINMKKIFNLSKIYNFKIIEDASHALGAKIGKEFVGSSKYSDLTVFSLHPVKMITTGEGGIVTTNNSRLQKKIISLRDHGIIRNITKNKKKNWKYDQKDLGFNFRLSDIQAALGISQLSRLGNFIDKRNKIAKIYDKSFKNLPIRFIKVDNNNLCSYHLYVILIKNKKKRNDLYYEMLKKGFKCNIHYIPIYKHSFYKKKLKLNYRHFENTENYYNNCLSIPLFPNLKKKEIKDIIGIVKKFFNEK